MNMQLLNCVKGEDAKKHLREVWKENAWLRGIIMEFITKTDVKKTANLEDFQNPSWALEQAYREGYSAACQKLFRTLETE